MNDLYDPDEDELDDREMPAESDMDPEDDPDETSTEPCPHCHRDVHFESQICPYCGKPLRQQRRTPIWIAIVTVVCVVLMILYALA